LSHFWASETARNVAVEFHIRGQRDIANREGRAATPGYSLPYAQNGDRDRECHKNGKTANSSGQLASKRSVRTVVFSTPSDWNMLLTP